MIFKIKKPAPVVKTPMLLAAKVVDKVMIKHLIHKRLAGWEKARPHGTIHASELLKEKEFCPREWAFLDLGIVKKKDDYVGTAMRMTFDHGRDMEWRLRNDWLRDAMIGIWKCGICSHVHPTFGKAPKIVCPKCGWGHKWEYEETRLLDPVSGVSGGIDGFVDVGSTKAKLLEIKSMDKDEHKGLLAPKAEHKFRTALYLKLVSASPKIETDRINPHEASILYVSKSYGFKDESLKAAGIVDAPFSPFKEFLIGRDDALVRTPLNRATAVTLYRKMAGEGVGAGLPCGICVNGLTKRAQQCTAVGPCFSGSFPATITWLEEGVPKHPDKKHVVGEEP